MDRRDVKLEIFQIWVLVLFTSSHLLVSDRNEDGGSLRKNDDCLVNSRAGAFQV